MEQLKVSTRSNPNSVAGAMAGVVRSQGAVEVQVVGAGALNQAIKAVAIACGYVAASGIELVCIPEFADITIDGEKRTAIRLRVEDRVPVPDGDDVVALDDPVVEAAIALDDPVVEAAIALDG
ncbi:MAG TPA: stage V sporulation protein S [Acidimicrobiaceae bacterium]|nr:stage V sporulation protein S [Acidimicrobiaceae bacterium]